MSRVLYEADKNYYSLVYMVLGFGFFIFVLGMLYFMTKRKCKDNTDPNINTKVTMRIVSIVCLVASCEALLVFGFGVVTQIHRYNHTVIPYKTGNYKVAEGYVTYFEKYPDDGSRLDDAFVVDNVRFIYSLSTPFDSYPEGYDGPVTGVGQHLRVKYVEYGNDREKVIMYIEELE